MDLGNRKRIVICNLSRQDFQHYPSTQARSRRSIRLSNPSFSPRLHSRLVFCNLSKLVPTPSAKVCSFRNLRAFRHSEACLRQMQAVANSSLHHLHSRNLRFRGSPIKIKRLDRPRCQMRAATQHRHLVILITSSKYLSVRHQRRWLAPGTRFNSLRRSSPTKQVREIRLVYPLKHRLLCRKHRPSTSLGLVLQPRRAPLVSRPRLPT